MTAIENNTFSRLLRLSSQFNIQANGRNTNFTNGLSRMTETNKIIRAVCKSVSFENNAYNIYTSGAFKNNVFSWSILVGGSFTHEIPVAGFYTAQQLIDILKPIIQATMVAVDAGAVLTMEIGDFSKKIEYSTNTNLVGLILDGGDSLNAVLGNLTTTSAIITGFPYTSETLPTLGGLQNVYVHSTTIAEGNLVDGDVENHDVIAEVPVDAPYGARVNYESRDDELDSVNYDSLRNFDSINISLRDIDNNEIELNGGNVIIVLKIYYL